MGISSANLNISSTTEFRQHHGSYYNNTYNLDMLLKSSQLLCTSMGSFWTSADWISRVRFNMRYSIAVLEFSCNKHTSVNVWVSFELSKGQTV